MHTTDSTDRQPRRQRITGPVPRPGLRTREFQLTDYDTVLEIWRRSKVNLRMDGRDSLEALERQLQVMGPFMLVAEYDGQPAGVVLGSHDGIDGFINRLAVDPAFRKKGIATRLYLEAERRLRDKGIDSIVLIAETDKQDAIEAFRRMGFRERLRVTFMVKA